MSSSSVADSPTAESLVSWLLEHQDVTATGYDDGNASESDPLSDIDDIGGDQDSVALDFEDLESIITETEVSSVSGSILSLP